MRLLFSMGSGMAMGGMIALFSISISGHIIHPLALIPTLIGIIILIIDDVEASKCPNTV